jgi:hypothetical protein
MGEAWRRGSSKRIWVPFAMSWLAKTPSPPFADLLTSKNSEAGFGFSGCVCIVFSSTKVAVGGRGS